MKKTFFVGILAVITFLCSCIKEQFDPYKISTSYDVKTGLAVPIGYSNMSVKRLVTKNGLPQEIREDENGFYTLIYNKKVFSLRAFDYIKFPTITHTQRVTNMLPIDIDLRFLSRPMLLSDSMSFDFEFNDINEARIDSMVLDSAFLKIDPQAFNGIKGEILIIFPNIRKYNVPLTVRMSLNGDNYTTNLTGYTMQLSTIDNKKNQLPVRYKILLNTSNAYIPSGGDLMDLNIEFSLINFKSLFGYLGKRELNIDNKAFNLGFFKEIDNGFFHFEQPKLNIKIGNSYGVPLQIALTDFQADMRDASIVPITGSGVPLPTHPKLFNYPRLNQVGQTVEDSLYLTPQTTNLYVVTEKVPHRVSFGVNGVFNPDSTEVNNFILDTSQYDVTVQFELPLWGYAGYMAMVDTFNLSLKDLYKNNIEEVKRLSFVLDITNGFPIEIGTQIFFTDENYNILDSMFMDNRLIKGGKDPNNDGKIEAYKNPTFFIDITQEKLKRIENTKYAMVWARISTPGAFDNPPRSVKFFSSYFIDTSLGVIVETEVNTSQIPK